ncbi:MAG: hypothetical protein ABIA76_00255 [Candidatus Diapherotrites archaeon]
MFDTDFSVTFNKQHKKYHYYPTIIGSLASKKLIEQTAKILKDFVIKPTVFTTIRKNRNCSPEHKLIIRGNEKVNNFIKKIGTNSSKHQTKIEIWKQFGFCPPHTKIKERKEILKGKINPKEFYKGGI